MKVHFSERGSLLCSPLPPLWIIHWNLIIWSWKHNPKSTLFLLLCSHYLIPCLWDLAWLARVPDCPTVPAQLADLSSGHITRVSDILHWYPIRIALYLYLHRYEAPEPHLPLSLMPMIKMLLSCKTNFNFSNMTNLYSCQAFESSLSLCLSQNDYSLSFWMINFSYCSEFAPFWVPDNHTADWFLSTNWDPLQVGCCMDVRPVDVEGQQYYPF